jgi:hypothetical protein
MWVECRDAKKRIALMLSASAQASANLSVDAETAAATFPLVFPEQFTTIAHLDIPAAHEACMQAMYNYLRHDASLASTVCRESPLVLAFFVFFVLDLFHLEASTYFWTIVVICRSSHRSQRQQYEVERQDCAFSVLVAYSVFLLRIFVCWYMQFWC